MSENKIVIPDRFEVMRRGKWGRNFVGTTTRLMRAAIRCLVCKTDLREDHEILVSELEKSRKPLFLCNDGLLCSRRLRLKQLKMR